MTEIKNKLNDLRAYHLRGEVGDESVDQLVKNILKHNLEDEGKDYHSREPILLSIESYGGGVNEGFSLVSAILESKTPVHTYCRGRAMSMGFILFVVGHKRFISRHATLMFHSASASYAGKVEQIQKRLDEGKRLTESLIQLTLDTTDVTREKIDYYLERKEDWYIDSKEALDLGIADEILGEYRNYNRDKSLEPIEKVDEEDKKSSSLKNDSDLKFIKKLGDD